MLVLSRKKGEGITLQITTEGEQITVNLNVIEIRDKTMRLGITAPRETVKILRNELIEGQNATNK